MHNILLIARREYMERVRTKGFKIATILIPTLMGGGVFATPTLGDGWRGRCDVLRAVFDVR